VIGPSGSGKTVVMNFLLAQARKFRPQIMFFDKDRGAELFIRAIGGQYDRLRPGEPTGLNPLQMPDTPENRQFLLEWLGCSSAGLDGRRRRARAGRDRGELPAAGRTAPACATSPSCSAATVGRAAGDLYSRLKPWWGSGDRAWLFDNEHDRTDLRVDVVGFDMTAVLDDPQARTPALYYFFHRVEERLDGTPSIIVVDEGWKALDDEIFVRRSRTGKRPSASATAWSASPRRARRMRSRAASAARSSSRRRRRSS
jgi:type IV secretion system protein VirB4